MIAAQQRLVDALQQQSIVDVLDGRDHATVAALFAIDPHLAGDIETGQRLREAAERMASGRWIAFADIPRSAVPRRRSRLAIVGYALVAILAVVGLVGLLCGWWAP